jgi:hypothetical protein
MKKQTSSNPFISTKSPPTQNSSFPAKPIVIGFIITHFRIIIRFTTIHFRFIIGFRIIHFLVILITTLLVSFVAVASAPKCNFLFPTTTFISLVLLKTFFSLFLLPLFFLLAPF